MENKETEDFFKHEEMLKEIKLILDSPLRPTEFLLILINKTKKQEEFSSLEKAIVIEVFNYLSIKEENNNNKLKIEEYDDDFCEINIIQAAEFSEDADWAVEMFSTIKEAYHWLIASVIRSKRADKKFAPYLEVINKYKSEGEVINSAIFLEILMSIYCSLVIFKEKFGN